MRKTLNPYPQAVPEKNTSTVRYSSINLMYTTTRHNQDKQGYYIFCASIEDVCNALSEDIAIQKKLFLCVNTPFEFDRNLNNTAKAS
ncbi:unnamed protein product [Mucor fragilis]